MPAFMHRHAYSSMIQPVPLRRCGNCCAPFHVDEQSQIADSALEDCQVQASRRAPISAIPVRSPSPSLERTRDWHGGPAIAGKVEATVCRPLSHLAWPAQIWVAAELCSVLARRSATDVLADTAMCQRQLGRPHTPQDAAWIETLFGHVKMRVAASGGDRRLRRPWRRAEPSALGVQQRQAARFDRLCHTRRPA